MWYMRTSTLCGPNSAIRGVSSEAVVGLGVSRVPRNASVRKETCRLGFCFRASRMVLIRSCSVLPMYRVLR